jgi:hypothetical protein
MYQMRAKIGQEGNTVSRRGGFSMTEITRASKQIADGKHF